MKAKHGMAFLTSLTKSSLRHRHFACRIILGYSTVVNSFPTIAHSYPLDDFSLKMSTTAGAEEACARASHDGKSSGNNFLRNHLSRLRSSPTETLILDGGTGEELFLRGVPDDRKTWSAYAITHDQYHSVVEDVHKSFIDAGSQAITTNSYGITPGVGFTDGGEVKRLVGISGEIARRAVTGTSLSNPVALVLGSLGPLVESYRADLIMKHEDGVRAYRYPIEGLYPHVDVYVAETMSCFEEVCQAIDALSKFYQELTDSDNKRKHPILVSFTLDSEGRIRSGELIVDVIPKLVEYAHDKKVECKCSHFLLFVNLSPGQGKLNFVLQYDQTMRSDWCYVQLL